MENKNFILFVFLINLNSFIRLSPINNDNYGYILLYCNQNCQFKEDYKSQNTENIDFFINDNTEKDINAKYKMEMHFKTIDQNNLIIFKNFVNSPDDLLFIDFSNFNTSSLTNMSNMLSELKSLKSIDLSYLNFSSVTDMENMFLNCI